MSKLDCDKDESSLKSTDSKRRFDTVWTSSTQAFDLTLSSIGKMYRNTPVSLCYLLLMNIFL